MAHGNNILAKALEMNICVPVNNEKFQKKKRVNYKIINLNFSIAMSIITIKDTIGQRQMAKIKLTYEQNWRKRNDYFHTLQN